MKKIFLILMILLFISLVSGSDWNEYAQDNGNTFVYFTARPADFEIDFVSNPVWTCNIQSSDISPLIEDLDGDGINELVTFNENSTSIYDGYCNLKDEYTDVTAGTTFIPVGQAEIVDYLTSYSGNEIVMVVNTNNVTDPYYRLWAIHWNGPGAGFVTVQVSGVQESNGLNCHDIDDDGLVECIYLNDSGHMFMYDENESSPTSFIYNASGNVCLGGVPYLIDYDDDNDKDIFINIRVFEADLGAWYCRNVDMVRYDGGSTFTLQQTYSVGSGTYALQEVSGIAVGNIDKTGPNELVISYGTNSYCDTNIPTISCAGRSSGFIIYNLSGTNSLCSASNRVHKGGGNYDYPYVTGLRIGEYDGDNELEIFVAWLYSRQGNSIGIYNDTCGNILYQQFESDLKDCGNVQWGGGSFGTPNNWVTSEGIWADMDDDDELEFLWGQCVSEENGTLWEDLEDNVLEADYLILGELTGDSKSEYLYSLGDELIVYHSSYNCSDIYGVNYTVKEDITYNNVTYLDSCINNTYLSEKICSADVNDTIIKDCTDFNNTWVCFDGACVMGDVPPVIHNMTSYGWDTRVTPNRWLHHSAYVVNEVIIFKGSVTDANDDNIHLAVDCDIGDAFGVGDWGPANQLNTTHWNCTYDPINNYTARIYVTDAYGGDWSNYSIYINVDVKIQECFNYLDCLPGYLCSATGICFIPSNTTNCTDTDSGVDENVTGTVTTIWENLTDYCYDGDTVLEYYCDDGSPSGYYSLGVTCAPSWICFQGQCTNTTNSTTFKVYVKDYNTFLPLDGVEYTIAQYPSYTVVASGTISSGEQELSLELGYYYQMVIEDPSENYKRWWENWWYPDGSDITALMERHCTGSCVYSEYFGYTDSPYHHGWRGANFSTYYDSTLGFVGNIEYAISTSDWYTIFPAPGQDVTIIEYDIQIANDTPADGQSLKVYIQDENGDNIFALWYVVDETSGNEVWYFDTTWHDIPLSQAYLSTTAIDTYLVYQKSTGQIDIYLDSLNTGNYIFYIDNNAVISALDVERIEFDVVGSPYNLKMFVDNIEVSQSSVEPSEPGGDVDESDPTSPAAGDLTQPWYRDSEDNLKFDPSVCAGYNSYILCAASKYVQVKIAGMVAWVFTGLHILYFIVIIILIIIIGPLIVEFFRPRK